MKRSFESLLPVPNRIDLFGRAHIKGKFGGMLIQHALQCLQDSLVFVDSKEMALAEYREAWLVSKFFIRKNFGSDILLHVGDFFNTEGYVEDMLLPKERKDAYYALKRIILYFCPELVRLHWNNKTDEKRSPLYSLRNRICKFANTPVSRFATLCDIDIIERLMLPSVTNDAQLATLGRTSDAFILSDQEPDVTFNIQTINDTEWAIGGFVWINLSFTDHPKLNSRFHIVNTINASLPLAESDDAALIGEDESTAAFEEAARRCPFGKIYVFF
jgi:hypothetical protein